METKKIDVVDKRTRDYKESMKEVPSCHKCGKTEDLIEVSPQVRICRSCIGKLSKVDVPKGTDYSKSENNPGFKLCSVCGRDNLEPNDDGSPKRRRQPEACHDCVWESENKIKCTDGVIRNRKDCKKVVREVGEDKIISWVKK